MRVKRAYRDRSDVEVAVLDALVERGGDGMTVLELRTAVDADIEAIRTALEALKRDGLIEVSTDGDATLISPDDKVVPEPGEEPERPSLLAWLRERLPF
jgi:predicted transcriptional regulator